MTIFHFLPSSPACRVALLLALLALPVATLTAGPTPWPEAVESKPTSTQRYPLKGVVVEVHADNGKLLVKHEEIPGFMPGMTMLFRAEVSALKELNPGDRITATLVVHDDDYLLEQITIIKR